MSFSTGGHSDLIWRRKVTDAEDHHDVSSLTVVDRRGLEYRCPHNLTCLRVVEGMDVTVVRADQVGSLLRPAELLAARSEYANGTRSEASLREVEDEAILAVLGRQQEVGIEVLSDGELRRTSWITEMADAVDGFASQSRTVEWRGPGGGTEVSTSKVVGGKLQRHRRLAGTDTSFLAEHVPAGSYKITLPAASNFYVMGWQDGVSDAAYSSREEMMVDIVAILREEIEELLADGVSYIQLDSPFYSHFIDESARERLRAAGEDPDVALAEAVGYDNACLVGLSGSATLALHVCRGNSRGRWYAEGGYEPIAEVLFGTLEVDRFLLEYDSKRDGDFSPLRFLPEEKDAVLGLVSTKGEALEDPKVLLERIDEAARVVPLERLALSPQCGFASVADGNPISEEAQWEKLGLVVQLAQRVWS
jgi:5-methyltetrahydropteroyltriglutamate--homocysteine methyltransferase